MEEIYIIQFAKLTKRIFTYDDKINYHRRIICFLPPCLPIYRFNKYFLKIFVTYKNRSKLIRKANEIINPEFTKKPLKEKILDLLNNPDSLIDYGFKIIIPMTNKITITEKDLNKSKSRIRKKINKLRRIGKII